MTNASDALLNIDGNGNYIILNDDVMKLNPSEHLQLADIILSMKENGVPTKVIEGCSPGSSLKSEVRSY